MPGGNSKANACSKAIYAGALCACFHSLPDRRGIVKRSLHARAMSLAMTGVLAISCANLANADTSPTRSSAALTSLKTLPLSEALTNQLPYIADAKGIAWPQTFVATHSLRERSRELGRRLFFEARQLAAQARFDESLPAKGLARWTHIIRRMPVGGRQIGRIDPIALWRVPQLDIPLKKNDWVGQCQPRHTIELWSAMGVSQLEWHSGLTLRAALAGLPGATGDAEEANVITQAGVIIPRGIAAWNSQPYELAPGDRIVVNLPRISASTAWVNRSLPQWLSLQWPGHDCRVVDAITGETQAPEFLMSLQDQPSRYTAQQPSQDTAQQTSGEPQ